MAKTNAELTPVDELTYEAAVAELEAIVADIESGEQPLEATMAAHTRGRALVQRCRAVLDTAEQHLKEVAVDELAGGMDEV